VIFGVLSAIFVPARFPLVAPIHVIGSVTKPKPGRHFFTSLVSRLALGGHVKKKVRFLVLFETGWRRISIPLVASDFYTSRMI